MFSNKCFKGQLDSTQHDVAYFSMTCRNLWDGRKLLVHCMVGKEGICSTSVGHWGVNTWNNVDMLVKSFQINRFNVPVQCLMHRLWCLCICFSWWAFGIFTTGIYYLTIFLLLLLRRKKVLFYYVFWVSLVGVVIWWHKRPMHTAYEEVFLESLLKTSFRTIALHSWNWESTRRWNSHWQFSEHNSFSLSGRDSGATELLTVSLNQWGESLTCALLQILYHSLSRFAPAAASEVQLPEQHYEKKVREKAPARGSRLLLSFAAFFLEQFKLPEARCELHY